MLRINCATVQPLLTPFAPFHTLGRALGAPCTLPDLRLLHFGPTLIHILLSCSLHPSLHPCLFWLQFGGVLSGGEAAEAKVGAGGPAIHGRAA